MPAVSDEDLQKIRDDNDKKREQIAAAQSKQSEQEALRNREYEQLQLQAEGARLDAQLAQAKAASTVSASKDGAANVLDAARAELENAQAVANAPAREPEPPLPGDAQPGDKSEGGN